MLWRGMKGLRLAGLSVDGESQVARLLLLGPTSCPGLKEFLRCEYIH